MRLIQKEVAPAIVAVSGIYAYQLMREAAASEEVLARRIGVSFGTDRNPPELEALASSLEDQRPPTLAACAAQVRSSAATALSSLVKLKETFGPNATVPALHQAFAAVADSSLRFFADTLVMGFWFREHHPNRSNEKDEEWTPIGDFEVNPHSPSASDTV